MKTDILLTIVIAIVGIAFILWLIERFRNNNRNVVVVNTGTGERVIEQPIQDPRTMNIGGNFGGSFGGNAGASAGGNAGGARVQGGGGVTH